MKKGEPFLKYDTLFAWAMTELLFTAIVEGKFVAIRPIDDYYVHVSSAIVFGITLGLSFDRFIFNKSIPYENK
jgi:hypothetical protein